MKAHQIVYTGGPDRILTREHQKNSKLGDNPFDNPLDVEL